eukprot:c46588_g1_i1 orf=98-292(+)
MFVPLTKFLSLAKGSHSLIEHNHLRSCILSIELRPKLARAITNSQIYYPASQKQKNKGNVGGEI